MCNYRFIHEIVNVFEIKLQIIIYQSLLLVGVWEQINKSHYSALVINRVIVVKRKSFSVVE